MEISCESHPRLSGAPSPYPHISWDFLLFPLSAFPTFLFLNGEILRADLAHRGQRILKRTIPTAHLRHKDMQRDREV